MSNSSIEKELKITNFIDKMIEPVIVDGVKSLTNIVNPEHIPEQWKAFDRRRMNSSLDGNVVNYYADLSCDYLINSRLITNLPPICVKEKFRDTIRIAWCHNIGHNIVKTASFYNQNSLYNSLDSTSLDMSSQYMMKKKNGSRKEYNFYCGNHPLLVNFSDKLPKFTIDVLQPWYYSQHIDWAFPLLYVNKNEKVYHRYDFRLKVTDLIRVQKLNEKTNEWENVTKSSSKFSHYLDISCDTIPTPELYGYYSILSKESRAELLSCVDNQRMYIPDIVSIDNSVKTPYGGVSEIMLKSDKPAIGIMWVAENCEAVKNNNYSNYTTNEKELRDGWDPIVLNSLSYSTDYKFQNSPSNLYSKCESFSSCPTHPGYHAFSYAWRPTGCGGDVAVDVGDIEAKLKCLISEGGILDNSNAYINDDDVIDSDDESDEEKPKNKNSQSFRLKVRLIVLHHLTIKKNGETFEMKIE